MRSDIRLLDQVQIEKPCEDAWEEMQPVEGNRVRHCAHCQLNVYNLSDMSRQEAEELLQKTEGRLCVQYAQRDDGKILTDNCPDSLRGLRNVVLKQWAAAASFIAAMTGLLTTASASAHADTKADGSKPIPQKPNLRSAKGDKSGSAVGSVKGKTTVERGELMAIPLPDKKDAGKKTEVQVFRGKRVAPTPPKPVANEPDQPRRPIRRTMGKPVYHKPPAKPEPPKSAGNDGRK